MSPARRLGRALLLGGVLFAGCQANGGPEGQVTLPTREVPAPSEVDAGAGEMDCDLVMELRAHDRSGDGDEPFLLDGPGDLLESFAFEPPWQGPVHALRFDPIIDNPAVVHHMLIAAYELPGENEQDSPLHGFEPLGEPLVFWLPGSGAAVMPEGVGLRMLTGENVRYALRVHYLSDAARASDRSGFRICATRALRPHEAALHMIGSEDILIPGGAAYETGVDCYVQGQEPVHVLSVLPHMHDFGHSFELAQLHADGSTTPLLDEPFDRWLQRSYRVNWQLQPGEGLRARCRYENTGDTDVAIGMLARDEMCWFFTIAYPAGRLTDPDDPHHRDGCIQRFDLSRL
ncbi:MAG: hypothetical protein PVI30_22160 [Myxococcales bacterium]|jgi:hypothetical protein